MPNPPTDAEPTRKPRLRVGVGWMIVFAVIFTVYIFTFDRGSLGDGQLAEMPIKELEDMLIGKTEAEVRDLLGEPDKEVEQGHGKAPSDPVEKQKWQESTLSTSMYYNVENMRIGINFNLLKKVFRVWRRER